MSDLPTLNDLAALVLKSGVGLGGLKPAQRELALCVAAASLPFDVQLTEREVNLALKGVLSGSAAFIGTDHVELRRWLVDTRWWQRDGFGRAYWRTPRHELTEDQRAVDDLVAPLDLPSWIALQRSEAANAREARRAAWQARLNDTD